jgi:hypothetical protein
VLDDVANRHNFDKASKAGFRRQFNTNVDTKAKKLYVFYAREVGVAKSS